MSKNSEIFEEQIAAAAKKGKKFPKTLPQWMVELGIRPGTEILSSKKIGNNGPDYKTDVIIELKDSTPIKISAKLSNADYYGNWYGHERCLQEFGVDVFKIITKKFTDWANNWLKSDAKYPFVGVSISFGERSGQTFFDFDDVFSSTEEIKKIVAGAGIDEKSANCLYNASKAPNNIDELIENLVPINDKTIEDLSSKIKIILRPVNPQTSYSDRSKCVYTKFRPTARLKSKKTVTSINEFRKLGKFVTVEPTCINHNHILNELEENYNIVIPKKPWTKKNK